jgi:hypothetical protein
VTVVEEEEDIKLLLEEELNNVDGELPLLLPLDENERIRKTS